MHAHGLLRTGSVPSASIRRLRDYQRLRADPITMGAAHVQHMQKALERMNVKIHDVLSRLTGESGLRLVRAILEGARDPQALVEPVGSFALWSGRWDAAWERVWARLIDGCERRDED